MKRALRTVAFLAIIAGALVLLNHMVAIRFLEMQYQIQRDRFINFDLSSRLLIFRMNDLTGQRSEMRDELSGSVLETKLLSDLEKEFETLTLLDRFSLAGMNGIRYMVLKTPLRLESGRGALKTLQIAFYFERTKHYASAVKVYRESLESQELPSDAEAFAMLHLGFCYVVVGNLEEALRLLVHVRSQQSTTHFGETADMLIRMILQGDRDAKAIEASEGGDLVKARQLAAIGRCHQALAYYGKTSSTTDLDLYNRADCLERTGKIKDAMARYGDVIQETSSKDLKAKAARRLLIIGEFYGGGTDARRFATETLEANGDAEGLALMESAQKDRKADVAATGDQTHLPESVKEELTSVQKEPASLKGIFPEVKRKVVFIPPALDDFDITVETFGGRKLRIHSSVVETSEMEGESGTMRVRFPVREIRRIAPAAAGQAIRVFLRSGASVQFKELTVEPGVGFKGPGSDASIPFEQVARIMGEKQ